MGEPLTEVHEPASKWFAKAFLPWADAFAMMLGGPLYLVGSALVRPDPADFDVRAVLRGEDWDRLFGIDTTVRDGDVRPVRWWNAARFELKQSRRLSRALGVCVDFQVKTIHEWSQEKYMDRPRLRLDKAPDDIFLAGLGEP